MTNKPIALGRAPRPRTNPADLERLVADGAETGFGRPLTGTNPEPKHQPTVSAPLKEAEPLAPLRLEVPERVWTALKLEAVRRKVSVKYLVIEALAAKGYGNLDLSEIPEDGRRRSRR